MTTLTIHPAALTEAETAARWYEDSRPGHGMTFRREVDQVIGRIGDHPAGYQLLGDRFRRAFLRRFPFVVVYRIVADEIEIIAIVPTRADPVAAALLIGNRSS